VGLEPTVTFTGLPVANSHYGPKAAILGLDNNGVFVPLLGASTAARFEVFYSALEKNNPGGLWPNWFFYYRDNQGGSDYTYACDPTYGTSFSFVGVPGSVKICDEAYFGDTYIRTAVVGGHLVTLGTSTMNKYYANFIGVLAHEMEHATNQTRAGPPLDRDSDYLSNVRETTVSFTDPDNPCSAALSGSFLSCDPAPLGDRTFDDGEVYAGGPVEEAGVRAANTSHDWGDPGTNH
jgi:hypothetical protein